MLPAREKYLKINDYREVADAIKRLAVRGAPAIGIAAAYGVALGALAVEADNLKTIKTQLKTVIKTLGDSRPTARQSFLGAGKNAESHAKGKDIAAIQKAFIDEAQKIHQEQIVSDKFISQLGSKLFDDRRHHLDPL